jgi:cytochrome o ubiquinol oxidase operon protein cyoD
MNEQKHPGSFASYATGFIIAVVLTVAAYLMVMGQWFESGVLVFIIMGLAAVQLVVQLVFFLHLGRDGVRWKAAAFYAMFIILVLIVGGSLWIMYNLDYNMMMSPEEMNEFMLKESEKGF